MDSDGFDYDLLQTRTAPKPASNHRDGPPPFSTVLQKPSGLRKPFGQLQTQSRNNHENVQMPSASSRLPQSASSRRQPEPRMKQEPSDHIPMPLNTRRQQNSFASQTRNDPLTQSQRTRAFAASIEEQQPAENSHYLPSQQSTFKMPDNRNHIHTNPTQHAAPASPAVPRSRSASMQIELELDHDDSDFSHLMNKHMRETKIVKTKLAEQCKATAALEAQLSAQRAASEAAESTFKGRVAELEAREHARLAHSNEELRRARTQAEEADENSRQLATKLQDLHSTTAQGLEQVRKNYDSLQQTFSALKAEYDTSQVTIKLLSKELAGIRQSAAEGRQELESSDTLIRLSESRSIIAELQSDRSGAHQVIDMLRDKLHLLSAQLVEAKDKVAELESAREGKIERVESKLEDLTDKLRVKEEQGVRDQARALALESRLAECTEKLAQADRRLLDREYDLDEARQSKVALEWEVKQKDASIVKLEGSTADLAGLKEEKLALECMLREKAARIVLFATVESDLKAAKDENLALEMELGECRTNLSRLQALEPELLSLRERKTILECELGESRDKISACADELRGSKISHEETAAKLDETRTEVHSQKTQIVQLRTELKAVKATRDELKASYDASRESKTKLVQQIQTAKTREAVLEEKATEMTARANKVLAEAAVRDQEIKRAETQCTILQERFEAQVLTLKLAKEQNGDLQERLILSESAQATKLESAVGKFKSEIVSLQDHKATLEANLAQTQDELAIHQTASIDFEHKLSKQEEAHAKSLQAQESRAQVAEREAVNAKRLVEDLTRQIEAGRAELDEVKKKAREDAARGNPDVEGEVLVLRARVEQIETENSQLQHRARMINKRYQDGDLSDSEKSFVSSLMQMTQSVHEQDMVDKENELRRRENMIVTQQKRIDTLESTLARLLKERGRGDAPKSMVDLSLWMSSSSPYEKLPSDQDATKAKPAKPILKPTSRKSEFDGVNTSELSEIEDEHGDDDKPVTALGKRSRLPEDSGRPSRRLRQTNSRISDISDPPSAPAPSRKSEAARKAGKHAHNHSPEPVKSKQRKRR